MEIESPMDLGRRLRARRTAAGRTIASVAVQAGLSVPYIANLENGRGNPTLGALTSLAQALGTRLRVELADVDAPEAPGAPIDLPTSLVQFARLPRFAREAGRAAEATGAPVLVTRERLLTALAGIGATCDAITRGTGGDRLRELDWHRILDAIVLIINDQR
jgi:transcriptional regulator with XRE-family HTH domain